MTVEVIDPMYQPFSGGDHPYSEEAATRDQIAWARSHALRWAEQAGLEDEEAYEFAEFFKEGWLLYLKENASEIDKDFREMLKIFREEKASGEQEKR